MESWRQVWREGFAPQFSLEQLEHLRQALEVDDPRLIQGGTTVPPPMQFVQGWPIECGCAISYPFAADNGGFRQHGLEPNNPDACTVAEAEEWFAQACYACDLAVGEPAGCRFFLNWFDATPRPEVLRELLSEVERAIQLRMEELALV